jgi:hypothetical protein
MMTAERIAAIPNVVFFFTSAPPELCSLSVIQVSVEPEPIQLLTANQVPFASFAHHQKMSFISMGKLTCNENGPGKVIKSGQSHSFFWN